MTHLLQSGPLFMSKMDFFFFPGVSTKWYFVLFFFYDTSEEKFLTSDLSFSQVTEVDKREPRESFSKPRPHF